MRQSCSNAVKSGAGNVDMLVLDKRDVSLEVENNSIKFCDVEYDAGYSVRAITDGGTGYVRGRGLERNDLLNAGGEAALLSKESEPDPDFKSLPKPQQTTEIEDLFDNSVAEFEPSAAIKWGLSSIEAAKNIDPEVIVKCGISAGSVESAIVNSNGVNVFEAGTYISMYVFSVVRREEGIGSYYEYSSARCLKDLESPEELARKATERAVAFAGAKKIESGRYPVLLGPLAARSLTSSVIGAASAEEIQRERSYLAGKLNKKIAPDLLTIEEDPFFPGGISSSPFDGEGVPREKRLLIDRGVLTTYLHNSYTANKAGVKNTGHASREYYTSNVGISASNLSTTPGGRPEADIIKDIKNGIYIYMGSVSPSSVSGQISGTVDYGFRIIDGELAYPVQNVMIGGDVFEFLNSIEEISSDYRDEKANRMPSILIGQVQLSGGA